MTYTVYYLYSIKLNKYYIGKTNNINRRLKEHNNGEEIYTKKGTPWTLIGYIECKDNNDATKLESKFKKAKNPRYIKWYIENHVKKDI